MKHYNVSERRSCELIGISRSSYRYEPTTKETDAALAAKLREIAEENRVAGYRTAWAYLRREGMKVNHKRVYRIWKEEGLSTPRKKRRVRKKGSSVPLAATHPNHVWTYDFVHDRTVNGQPLRILTVEDEYTREGLKVAVGRNMPASRVKEVLEGLFAERGVPGYIRSDNGPEFIATALMEWLFEQDVKPHHIEPGSPWQNAYGESFNATLRRECLNQELFHSLLDATVKTERWRRWYNETRPHSALGYLTPVEFRDGVRIELLEHGRPSSHHSIKMNERMKHEKTGQTLYLSVVQN
jgi:transposase InsO family protein